MFIMLLCIYNSLINTIFTNRLLDYLINDFDIFVTEDLDKADIILILYEFFDIKDFLENYKHKKIWVNIFEDYNYFHKLFTYFDDKSINLILTNNIIPSNHTKHSVCYSLFSFWSDYIIDFLDKNMVLKHKNDNFDDFNKRMLGYFAYSNKKAIIRNIYLNFFHNKYNFISHGQCLNKIQQNIINDDKLKKLKYKFGLAFENNNTTLGYLTEKLFNTYLFADTVPIYWGYSRNIVFLKEYGLNEKAVIDISNLTLDEISDKLEYYFNNTEELYKIYLEPLFDMKIFKTKFQNDIKPFLVY